MKIATKLIILPILINMNLFYLQDCDCEMWFKKLQIPDSKQIVTRMYDKPPIVSGIKVGTIVQDSIGPYGDIFMDLIINDNDKIVCSRILKGDSALLPKVEKYLSKQTVSSAENYGRKVYSLYFFRLQFTETSENKRRKHKL
jgi:hypothetical protein